MPPSVSQRHRPAGFVLLGLIVLVAVALAWRAWSSRVPARPVLGRVNVLLVTIDTLRDDRVSAALTPVLEMLAAGGVRFTRARSVVPLTLPAHASLMTALLPPHHGVRLNGVHRLRTETPTLARLLQSAGYRTGAVVGAYVLDHRFGLAQGFETYDDEIPRAEASVGLLEAERRGDVVADRAAAWLRALPSDGRPFFLWVHLYDPHAPYTPPHEWLERARGQAYDGEVAYADAQLGRVVEALRALRLVDRTLTVVAGDHGESLGDHGEATHGLLVYEAAIRVPLVFASPALTPSRRDDATSLVDVVPTVLGLLGLSAPARHDGRDLFVPGVASTDAEVYSETRYPEVAGCSPLQALVTGRWKYIGAAANPELYDLATDPAEQRDLVAERRTVAEGMGRRVAELGAGDVGSASAAVSPEVVERLRALGYVATAPVPSATGPAAPSPTTIVREWDRFQNALSDLDAGLRHRALPTLAAIAQARPDASVFQATWARALTESGDPRTALEVYRRALQRWPQDTMLLHGYAIAAHDAGLVDEAMKAELAVVAIDPTDAAAQNGIGLLQVDANRPAEARAAFEHAVQLDPHAVPYWVNLGNARRAVGDLAGAEAAYREAIRLDPGSADGANGLGVLLVQAGRPAEAVPIFEQALAASPEFYEAWLNLGIAYQEAGDRARAAEAYRHVLTAPARFADQRRAAARLLSSLSQTRQ